MATDQILGASELASALSQLPPMNATAPTLQAARVAIARAIATGQSVDEITTGFQVPLGNPVVTRIVVLDSAPTALGGLERPAWARALSPAASYGPIAASGPVLQNGASKWIQVFTFTEVVQFQRSGTVLCVVPLSIFHFGSPT